MLHTVLVVEGIYGSCWTREKYETRSGAENRAELLKHLGKLARAESFDSQGQLIPMPSDSTKQLMQLLYPIG